MIHTTNHNPSNTKVEERKKDFQSLLAWQKDRYFFLGTNGGERGFLSVNLLRDGERVRVRLRLSKRTQDGGWQTLWTSHMSVWEFMELAEWFQSVSRGVLRERFGGDVR